MPGLALRSIGLPCLCRALHRFATLSFAVAILCSDVPRSAFAGLCGAFITMPGTTLPLLCPATSRRAPLRLCRALPCRSQLCLCDAVHRTAAIHLAFAWLCIGAACSAFALLRYGLLCPGLALPGSAWPCHAFAKLCAGWKRLALPSLCLSVHYSDPQCRAAALPYFAERCPAAANL